MYLTKQIKKSWLISLLLIGCSTTEHAPVIDRAPAAKPPVVTQSSQDGSNTHIVKKGDTLYSIGLEHGFDYKEIAQLNNIAAPAYTIHVGQQLKLPSRVVEPTTAGASPIPGQPASIADGDVVVTPLNLDGSAPADAAGQPAAATPSPGQPLLVVEPKALRQPYSEAALNTPVPAPQPQVAAATTPAAAAPPAASPATSEQTATASSATSNIDGIQWAWPTNGKVIAGFNDSASTKGLDIGGTMGQPIHAAAPGKVIYSGADLRGYGKLVIIKHDNTYLSVYAHNSNILVKEGQQVTRGQKIAEMGNTDSDKVKLHFEIRRQGKSVDPAKYLPGTPG
ncbi:peptidoglycan DD-metalloendopeptidase family protein [Methylobacillus arboreus]|uniref:peptidoglycan DD-metalloendopeptidase family protein n=1 Tax=Methylobacillus arboreus TaxID=755170 RepID=UPI001E4BC40A|nr:peptidoglycan DD-metalloendopeptidase family protein [Methylobacillus arboreus]MCB5189445.1 peptidoglycan DD-metalloendopeptidase family protein [Methylobacillus arboreus]